jgi:hypothetical protein
MGTSLGFGQVVLDCAIADQLAQFWSALVDRPVLSGANEFFAVVPASEDGRFPSLMFLAVPEPRQGKNRLHLDLTSTDLDGAVERAVSFGATKSRNMTSTAPSGPRWPIRRETCSTSVCRIGEQRQGEPSSAPGGCP